MTGRRGFVLVSVLFMTLATWALLAVMLSLAFLHYRLALGAERGAVAGAAADRLVAGYLAAASVGPDAGGAWPPALPPEGDAGCAFEIVEVAATDAWWRIRVRAQFEGAVAWREGTVHAGP